MERAELAVVTDSVRQAEKSQIAWGQAILIVVLAILVDE